MHTLRASPVRGDPALEGGADGTLRGGGGQVNAITPARLAPPPTAHSFHQRPGSDASQAVSVMVSRAGGERGGGDSPLLLLRAEVGDVHGAGWRDFSALDLAK